MAELYNPPALSPRFDIFSKINLSPARCKGSDVIVQISAKLHPQTAPSDLEGSYYVLCSMYALSQLVGFQLASYGAKCGHRGWMWHW